jgi:hypothetical protein
MTLEIHLSPNDHADAAVVAITVRWLERAVIGLNLCPFAKAVHVKQQIRYRVSRETDRAGLLGELRSELQLLQGANAEIHDTTLWVVPTQFPEFLKFNDFLGDADRLLGRHKLRGVLQIASFHPDYQFDGADRDDISNFTNRSPFAMLHLLREASVERAVAAFPQPEAIFEKNIQTLQAMGIQGWKALNLGVTGGGQL